MILKIYTCAILTFVLFKDTKLPLVCRCSALLNLLISCRHIGLLTFCLYYIMKNPEAMRKAREEVDEVLGDEQIQIGDLAKLKYITGESCICLRYKLSHSYPCQLSCARQFVSVRLHLYVWSPRTRIPQLVAGNTLYPRVVPSSSTRRWLNETQRSGERM